MALFLVVKYLLTEHAEKVQSFIKHSLSTKVETRKEELNDVIAAMNNQDFSETIIRWNRNGDGVYYKEYDDAAKRELMKIAAFLGEQIVKYRGGVWKLKNNVLITYMKKTLFMEDPMEYTIPILGVLVGRYLGNSRSRLELTFYDVIEESF